MEEKSSAKALLCSAKSSAPDLGERKRYERKKNYECVCCYYSTKNISNYKKHLKSKKHIKKLSFQNQETSKLQNELEKVKEENAKLKDGMKDMEIKHLKERLAEKPTTTNNHCNNTYNITITNSVYLKDHCKDALNYKEFIKNMNFQVTDFLYKSNNGLIKDGLAQAITKAIMDLPTNERPIHITDNNRGNFYIKVKDDETEEEEWKINDSNGKDIAGFAINARSQAICQTYTKNHEGVDENKGHDKQAKITTLLADKAADKNKKLIKHLAKNLPNIKDDIKELDC